MEDQSLRPLDYIVEDVLSNRPWLGRIARVRSDDVDVRRRGAILITLCLSAISLTLVLFVLTLTRSDMVASRTTIFATLFGATMVYLIGILIARRGHVDVAALGVITGLTVATLTPPLLTNTITPGLVYIVGGSMAASFALRARWVAVVVIANTITLGLVGWKIGQPPAPPMSSFLSDLIIMNISVGFAGWLAATFTQTTMTHLRRAGLEIQRTVKEEQASRLAREHAERASEAKSAFLANMSHELRTPLNAIIGYAGIVSEDIDMLGLQHEDMNQDVLRIEQAAQHLLALISDVLDFSKIEAGQMHIHVEAIDVPTLCEQLEDTLAPLVDQQHNTLVIHVDTDCERLHSDGLKVKQILLNLLSNAVKFTQNGEVSLTVQRHGEVTRFCVQDTGIGMDEETQDRVFEAFVQADASTTRRYGGTGIGLALVERLCQVLQGKITVASTPGQGTLFTVDLPDLG